MKEHIPERIRDQRVKELIRLSKELLEHYKQRFVGRRVEAILERCSTAAVISAGAAPVPASTAVSTAAGVVPASAANADYTSAAAASGEEQAKRWRGLTGNYLKVEIEGIPQNYASAGRLVAAEITHSGEIYRARFLEPVVFF